jgi:RNA polymerase sigma factor (sigma-70 family)
MAKDDDPKKRNVILRVLRRFSSRKQDLDDMMQETHLRMLQAEEKPFAHIESMDAYISTVAYRAGVDWAKKNKRMALLHVPLDDEAFDLPDGTADPERSAEALGRMERLARAIAKFPPMRRKVFEMKRWEGLTRQEIAARLGISESTVNTHLAKAASQLAAALHGS